MANPVRHLLHRISTLFRPASALEGARRVGPGSCGLAVTASRSDRSRRHLPAHREQFLGGSEAIRSLKPVPRATSGCWFAVGSVTVVFAPALWPTWFFPFLMTVHGDNMSCRKNAAFLSSPTAPPFIQAFIALKAALSIASTARRHDDFVSEHGRGGFALGAG